MRARIVGGLAVLLGVLLATAALAQDKPKGTLLTGADLDKLYRTKGGTVTEVHNLAFGTRNSTIYNPLGALASQWVDAQGAFGQDTGTWRIVGDTLCLKYKFVFNGQETCLRIFKVGDNAYETWSGKEDKLVTTFQVRP